ncbi:MAG: hypothetical protein ACLQFI_13220 [Methylocella sp.]
MKQIRTKLAALLLCWGDHAGNLGPSVDRRPSAATFRPYPILDSETIEANITGNPI